MSTNCCCWVLSSKIIPVAPPLLMFWMLLVGPDVRVGVSNMVYWAMHKSNHFILSHCAEQPLNGKDVHQLHSGLNLCYWFREEWEPSHRTEICFYSIGRNLPNTKVRLVHEEQNWGCQLFSAFVYQPLCSYPSQGVLTGFSWLRSLLGQSRVPDHPVSKKL